jgi:hypothetical protein
LYFNSAFSFQAMSRLVFIFFNKSGALAFIVLVRCPIFRRRPGPVSRVQVPLPRVSVCNIYTGIGRIA